MTIYLGATYRIDEKLPLTKISPDTRNMVGYFTLICDRILEPTLMRIKTAVEEGILDGNY